jgi:hypothetical protein
MSKPKVALIAGSAHGGTTILNMILGQHPQVFATGKLRNFPQGDVFSESNICSCGEAALACPYWQLVRERYLPFQDGTSDQKISRLIRLISDLSGRAFVGDVTHNVGYAELLQQTDGIELYLVHVVRDGRGVVYSRVRKDIRTGVLDDSLVNRLQRVIRITRRWSWQIKRYADLEKKLGARAVRVSYEAICRDPHTALQPVGDCLGLDFSAIGERLAAGRPLEPVPHMIRGNVKLRASKDVVLRHDTAYLAEMPRLDRAVFQLISRLPV